MNWERRLEFIFMVLLENLAGSNMTELAQFWNVSAENGRAASPWFDEENKTPRCRHHLNDILFADDD